jgi:hypothetical protein
MLGRDFPGSILELPRRMRQDGAELARTDFPEKIQASIPLGRAA